MITIETCRLCIIWYKIHKKYKWNKSLSKIEYDEFDYWKLILNVSYIFQVIWFLEHIDLKMIQVTFELYWNDLRDIRIFQHEIHQQGTPTVYDCGSSQLKIQLFSQSNACYYNR